MKQVLSILVALMCMTNWPIAALCNADGHAPPAARAHFVRATQLQRDGAYDAAIEEYEQAYAIAPMPALLFNMAQCHRLKGARSIAIKYYERYIELDPQGVGVPEASEHIDELQILAVDGGTVMPGLDTEIKFLGSLPAAAPLPGVRDVAASHALDVVDKRRSSHQLRTLGLITIGTGLLATGVGIWFGHEAQELAEDVQRTTDTWDASEEVRRGQNGIVVMYTLYSAGAALAVGGLTLCWLDYRNHRGQQSSPNRQEKPRSLVVLPVMKQGTFGISLETAF